MLNQSVNIQLHGLPVVAVFISNGRIALVKAAPEIKAVFDMPTEGISATFFDDKYVIDGREMEYNAAYAIGEIPELVKWLTQQNLESPIQ